jgi:predicted nuclease of predicted toxin-antitoxin system
MISPLLFDQNISFRIIKEISPLFPGSKQVREVGLEGKQDREVWNYAKSNGFTLVSFDSDFADLSLIFGFPPKVIWLRLGTSSTNRIIAVMTQKKEEIQIFLKNNIEGILKVESAL